MVPVTPGPACHRCAGAFRRRERQAIKRFASWRGYAQRSAGAFIYDARAWPRRHGAAGKPPCARSFEFHFTASLTCVDDPPRVREAATVVVIAREPAAAFNEAALIYSALARAPVDDPPRVTLMSSACPLQSGTVRVRLDMIGYNWSGTGLLD